MLSDSGKEIEGSKYLVVAWYTYIKFRVTLFRKGYTSRLRGPIEHLRPAHFLHGAQALCHLFRYPRPPQAAVAYRHNVHRQENRTGRLYRPANDNRNITDRKPPEQPAQDPLSSSFISSLNSTAPTVSFSSRIPATFRTVFSFLDNSLITTSYRPLMICATCSSI
jgi:hypothetical protein